MPKSAGDIGTEYGIALVRMELGQYTEARALFQGLLATNPGVIPFHTGLAGAELALGNRDAAFGIYAKAMGLFPRNTPLTVRYAEGTNPLRVVPCSRGDLPADCRLLNDGVPTLIAVSALASPAAIEALSARAHVEVIVCGEGPVDLEALMAALDVRGIRTLIVEGGSRLLHALHALGLVSRIIIKHIPVISGAEDAPTYLRPTKAGAPLGLSRWRLDELFALSGVAVSIYTPQESAP